MRIGVFVVGVFLVIGGCGKKRVGPGGGGGAGGAASPSGARAAEEIATLKAAWEATPQCRTLERCCTTIPGSKWQALVGPLCEQVATYRDFETQARNMVDETWQSMQCRNLLETLRDMSNEANPLPDACRPPGP